MARHWESIFKKEPDPTRAEIDEWQEEYWDVWYLEFEPGVEFLFRELSRGEYRLLRNLYTNKEEQEDWICRECILWPRTLDIDLLPAGMPEVLANMILKESGFSPDGDTRLMDYMSTFREEMSHFENQVGCVIHEAFPTLDIEEIEEWGMRKTLWYFSRAEFILNELQKRDIRYVTQEKAAAPLPTKPAQPQVPETGKPYQIEAGGREDFPELSELDAFLKGKGRYGVQKNS